MMACFSPRESESVREFKLRLGLSNSIHTQREKDIKNRQRGRMVIREGEKETERLTAPCDAIRS